MNRHTSSRFKVAQSAATAHAVALAVAAALGNSLVHPAYAEETQGLEEIVVTATKRETSLQQTPIAVTALTSEALQDANVHAVRDLAAVTPSLNFAHVTGIEVPVTLRGIASGGLGPGGESPVAVYLDGVFIAVPHASTFTLPDIERIEVLRGPQGTLYGQNTTAGAIKIITTTPDNDFKVQGTAEVGSFNLKAFNGTMSGPVVQNRLFAKISFAQRNTDNYYTNYYTGRPAGPSSESTLDGALKFVASDALDMTLRGDWNKSSLPNPRKVLATSVPAVDKPPIACPLTCDLTFTNGMPNPTDNFENWGTSATVKWNADFATLSSITAYREQGWFFLIDNSYLNAQAFPVNNIQHEHQFSQEINLTSNGSGPLQWVTGLYYFQDRARVYVPIAFIGFFPDLNADGVPENLNIYNWSNISSRAYAVFGEGHYQATRKLKLTVGARYGKTTRHLINDSLSLTPFNSPATELSPQPPVINGFAYNPPLSDANPAAHKDLSASWSYFIPRAILDYQLAEDVFGYSSVSKGYKSGGFDFVATNPGPFHPESLWSYELGVKSEFMQHRLRFNTALYYYDYSNLQETIQDATGQRATVNAADATIYGAELELQGRLTSALTVGGFATYTSTEFKNFEYDVSGFGLNPQANCRGGSVVGGKFCNLSGNRTPNSPRWTASVNAAYTIALGAFGALTPRLEYSYRSQTFFTIQNLAASSFNNAKSLDARLTYDSPDSRWMISVYGNNLTNDRYVDGAGDANLNRSLNPNFLLPTGSGRTIGTTNMPRNFGIQVTARM